ncbi:MAG TPA: transposase [Pseudonocardia sp.]
MAGEIGEQITQFDHPSGLQCYAGSAPVTCRSGKSDVVVARRLAHNHLTKGVLYDENIHVTNRNRALGRAA